MEPKRIASTGTILRRIGWAALIVGLIGIANSLQRSTTPPAQVVTAPSNPVPQAPTIPARQIIPGIVARIYKALDEGSPSSLRGVLSPNAQNNFQLFDAICKPYTYRTHYIENIIERPNNTFEVWVRVLFKPMDEHALALSFENRGGSFLLDGITDPPPNWFMEEKERALEVVHAFVSAAKAGRSDVLQRLIPPGLPIANVMTDSCWQLQLRTSGYEMPPIDQVTLKSYKGLKVEVDPSGPGSFLVEPVNGEYKVVGAFLLFRNTYMSSDSTCNDVRGMHGVEDPYLEARTRERFHVQREQ